LGQTLPQYLFVGRERFKAEKAES